MSTDAAITMPAHDIEAEQALLGACFLSRDVIKQSQALVHARDFFRSSHQKIYTAFCQLDQRFNGNGEDIDLHAMRAELERTQELEEIGGVAYLATLVDLAPTSVNYTYHASRIHEIALVRNYEEVGYRLQQTAKRHDVTPDMLRQQLQAQTRILEESPRPAWAFWEEIPRNKYRTDIRFDTLRFLEFLDNQFGAKVFVRREMPCIVIETAEGFDYCLQRGQQVVSLKKEVIDLLRHTGFHRIASELLNTPKLFTLDVLENLSDVNKEKVKHSVFAGGKTRVSLQDEYIGGDPIWIYQDDYDTAPRVLLNRHDIGMVVAKTGKGKTTSLELLVSQALWPESALDSPFRINLAPDEIIFHQDSEQSHDDNLAMLRRIAKRTHAKMNGLLTPEGEFKQHIFEMCADDVDDLSLWLLEKLESIKEKIGLIIIDTLLDLTDDMNEQKLSGQFFRELKRAARVRNCAILVTCHASDNSTDDDGKAMGHLGSLFARKAKCVLQVSIDADDPTIHYLSTNFKKAKARRASNSGMTAAFKFVDGMANWIRYEPKTPTKKGQKWEETKQAFREVLNDGGMPKGVLLKRYRKHTGLAERTAYGHYEQALAKNFIVNINGKLQLANYDE